MPTFRQLTLIGAKLDRPLGFFFAPPPEQPDVPETADFRDREDGELPSELVREIRRAEQHRDAMLDLGGRPESRPDIGPVTWDTLAAIAADLRAQFGLTDAFVPPESGNNQVFSFWRGSPRSTAFLYSRPPRSLWRRSVDCPCSTRTCR